jgi:serine/threonine protein kinase
VNADQWRAVHKLHVEACKLPAEAQRAHVEQNCSGDPEVRDQVLALLAAGGTKPRMVGPYEVRHRIGHGGMGEVWSGWSPELKRDVALKFVRSGVDLDVLRREAEVQAQLQSPRICPVIDFVGPDRGGPCLVMELLEGETLDARINALRKAPVWRFPHLLETAQQIAEGLEHAHAKGVVHCDLKPGNIMLTPQGVPPSGFRYRQGWTRLRRHFLHSPANLGLRQPRAHAARRCAASDRPV